MTCQMPAQSPKGIEVLHADDAEGVCPFFLRKPADKSGFENCCLSTRFLQCIDAKSTLTSDASDRDLLGGPCLS